MTENTLQDIAKEYPAPGGAVRAVDHVSLHVAGGELFFLLGPSGCGKTTLLRIVAGLVAPTAGRVLFDGRDVTGTSVEDRHTAMVFQNYALWPHMTVRQNVEFGPKMRRRPAAQRRTLVQEHLARVQISELARRKPSQLSGGQQQRVALARALAAGSRCLLLDEPLSNLDARLRLLMRGELRRLVKDTGVTAIYVTHDQKEALSMADRIAVMDSGRVVQTGTAEEIYNRPASRFVADFVGEGNFITGRVTATGPTCQIETTAGVLSSACAPCPPAGSIVTCCVRPERITIAPAAPVQATPPSAAPGASTIPATVQSVTYLGEVRQYTCRLASGESWRVTVLAGRDPA
ncbi:MAG: ABC transporter ATP-binding protein, partial [Phycisphaerae bacterium]|nr:ABC transporter ATP-binding protein [Phycisphaerae bacterium]